MRMELRHLRYFVAVAEELHFGRAAAATQSGSTTVQPAIRQLEKELGVILLRRTSRRVSLTDAGAVFLERAKSLLAQTDQAIDVVRAVEDGRVGHLTVAFVSSAALGVLPAVLKAFRRDYPGVMLTLREMTSIEQVEGAPGGSDRRWVLALAWRRRCSDHPTLARADCCSASGGTIASPDWSRCPFESDGEVFITYSGTSSDPRTDIAVRFYHPFGIHPRAIQQAGAILGVLGLVTAGVASRRCPHRRRLRSISKVSCFARSFPQR